MKLLLLSFFLFLIHPCFAQKSFKKFDAGTLEKFSKAEDTLSYLAFSLVNDSLENERFFATRELITTLVRTLKIPNSFNYTFPNLKSVSIQYPPDSTFRIFTWQLEISNAEFRYYGALQRKSDTLILFPLIDRSFNISNPEKELLSPENWMGCLVYGIKQMGIGDSATYLAFGFDSNDGKTRKKWIDPIRFVNGKPVFGAPIFPPSKEDSTFVPFRFILSYSAETTIKLNYDPQLDIIIFDHLTSMSIRPGQPEVFVPDGSYEGFKIHPNHLEYIEMLPVTLTNEEMLRPKPVLGKGVKDIFGKEVNQKKKKSGN